ncbi:ATP-binding cassette domain-containing protein [Pseudonocardia sp. CA-107938]|uniref:ATP-binding cassette domain-containing protein n=1 Tax=Pseudonocardia sp. CA-107938 TaxID=3240021 RepID=UPI003D9277B3
MPGEPVVELHRASKVFGGTVALRDVSLALVPGRVLALVGENGAGKSTCAKLLAGVHRPDAGAVLIGGREVVLRSPALALSRGIGVVHQHPGLFPDLSVAENIFTGHLPRRPWGGVDTDTMLFGAERWLARLGMSGCADIPLGTLSTSEQQLVEVARCLAAEVRVLVLDEPTAALSGAEVDRLFSIVDGLRVDGVAMMFVGHRLEEVFRVADDIAVLRDGHLVASAATADTTPDAVVRAMVGRQVELGQRRAAAEIGQVVLSVQGLTRSGAFEDVTFELRRGEVVGMAGIVGSGRTEVARALFGVDPPDAGTAHLFGAPYLPDSPTTAIARGVAYLSEDRRGQSLIEDFPILDNATLPVISSAARMGIIDHGRERSLVTGLLDRLRLKAAGLDQPARTLSGGNQQKVVLAKWLATRPRVLILDEPTQGVDVGAKAEVHRIVAELAENGLAILLISSDMTEVLTMSDCVLVMREGRLVAEIDGSRADELSVAAAALGLPQRSSRSTDRPGEPDPQTIAATRPPETPPENDAAPTQRPRTVDADELRTPWWKARQTSLAVALLVLVVPLGVVNPRFFSLGNLQDLFIAASLIGIVALGQMAVMLTRNIDLSVSSVIGLTAFLAAVTMRDHPDLPVIAGIALAAGVGAVCGAINGALVAYGRVSAIVTTLGTLAAFRGLGSVVSSGQQISAGSVPAAWLEMTTARPLGIPILIWIGAIACAGAALLLRRTVAGREVFAVGSNPDGAALIGVPVQRRVFATFIVSGVLAGIAGALWASRYATVDGQLALGVELTVIASVVVGGVALRGGSGTVLGVALGTLTLLVLQNALTLARLNPQYLQAVFGAAILLAILLDRIVAARTAQATRRTR